VSFIIAKIDFAINTGSKLGGTYHDDAPTTLAIIESHSDELAASLLDRVHNSGATVGYQLVPDKDLRDTVSEIYCHLSDWLSTRNEFDLEQRYRAIGTRRAQQGVPFSQVAWAIVFTKENLWDFLKNNLEMDPAAVFTDLAHVLCS